MRGTGTTTGLGRRRSNSRTLREFFPGHYSRALPIFVHVNSEARPSDVRRTRIFAPEADRIDRPHADADLGARKRPIRCATWSCSWPILTVTDICGLR